MKKLSILFVAVFYSVIVNGQFSLRTYSTAMSTSVSVGETYSNVSNAGETGAAGKISGETFSSYSGLIAATTTFLTNVEQVILLDIPGKTYGELDFELDASSNSRYPIYYSSSNTNVIVISENNASIVGSGEVTITASQVANETYLAGAAELAIEVAKAPLTVAPDGKSKVYGDVDPALTYQISSGGLVGTDQFSGELTRASGENVGNFAILQNTLTAGDNYALTFNSANLQITAKPLSIMADGKAKVYGESDPSLTYQLSSGSLVGGDVISGSLTRAAGENVGTYAISQNTVSAGDNYSISYTSSDLEITPRPMSIAADAQSKTYGDLDPTLTYRITAGAPVGTDDTFGALSRVAGENVGTYQIVQNTVSAGSNYDITYTTANLTIGAKDLGITAESKSKIYGANDPPLTYQLTAGSLVGTDALSGSLSRAVGENVGTYGILQNTVTAGNNYNISYTGAIMGITSKALGVTADAKSKAYGSSDPTLTYQITTGSLVGSDVLSGALSRIAGENVGSYTIQQNSLSGGSNYDLSYVAANMAITKAQLTATANDHTIAVGASLPIFTVSYASFVNGDNVNDLDVVPTASVTISDSSVPNNYTITVAGGSDNNYNYLYVNGTLTIQALLGLDPRLKVKIYPNPTQDFLMVESASILSLALYDVAGNIVRKGNSGSPLDVSKIATGAYILVLSDDENSESFRIIKK